MHEAGARVLQSALEKIGQRPLTSPLVCANNHIQVSMKNIGFKEKNLQTILGPIPYRRRAYRCMVCGRTRYPADESLNVVATGFSPGARRMMSRQGANDCFREGADTLKLLAGLQVSAKEIERTAKSTGRLVDDWMRREASQASLAPPEEAPQNLYVEFDGTGVAMRRKELEHSKGKAPDGRARTREVKLGCVFTQTLFDEEGKPQRDPASTSYVGAVESSMDFGYRIKAEAMRRGLKRAIRAIALTDGATYNKTIILEHFPNAIHVLDYYHAKEHLIDFISKVLRRCVDSPIAKELLDHLWHGRSEALIETMRALLPRSGERRNQGKKEINYFQNNAYAMRYEEFRRMGLFIGSGVIEAGCKTVIGKRLKGSGMFWSIDGANSIIALRCCLASARFEQFWEDSA